jgi:hypothetical protein
MREERGDRTACRNMIGLLRELLKRAENVAGTTGNGQQKIATQKIAVVTTAFRD